MKRNSADLRERLLGALDADPSQAEAARFFGVGTPPSSAGDGGGGRAAAWRHGTVRGIRHGSLPRRAPR